MALLRGRLFAGALFAGALFGVTQVPEAEAVTPPPQHYGSRKHEPLTFEYLRARDEYLALRRAPVAQPEVTSSTPPPPVGNKQTPLPPAISRRPLLPPVVVSNPPSVQATNIQPSADQQLPAVAIEKRKADEEAILLVLFDLL